MSERIILASGQHIEPIQDLWREYWKWLGLPQEFQSFAEEVRTLPGLYAPPRGRLLLAMVEDEAAATAALRPIGLHSCEVKRLYVRPQHRGCGIGKSLLDTLIKEAHAAGYREIYCDTLKSMTPALQMYSQAGFSKVEAYSSHPTPNAVFFRLSLSNPPPPPATL